MAFCNSCGTEMDAGVKFCPKCGQASDAASGAAAGAGNPSSGSVPAATSNDNVMGAVAYLTIIPAILFLVIEPYSKNRFVRFHAFQMIFLCLAMFAIWIAEFIIGMVLAFVPVAGPILGFVMGLVVFFGSIAAWAFAAYKAYQGEKYKLPMIGDLAEQQA